MRELFSRYIRFLIRTSAFLRKEIFEILRQTRLVITLIIGPFLILLLFGVGYLEFPPGPRTLFVVPEGSRIGSVVEQYAQSLNVQLTYAGITADPDLAQQQLDTNQVDLVIVTPADPASIILNNEQATIYFYHSEIDPYEEAYIQVLGRSLIEEINHQVLLQVAEQGQAEAESLQGYTQAAKEHAGAMRLALEGGNLAEATIHRQALQNDLNLVTLAAGSSLAVLAGVQNTTEDQNGNEAQLILQALENIRGNLNSIENTPTISEGEASAGAETASELEQDLDELDQMLSDFRRIDSFVLVSPFRSEVVSTTPVRLQPMHYFVPGVLALLLQHTAVTLGALSIIRERRVGTVELFQASPVSAFETLLGKYLSYLILLAGLAAVLTGLVVALLGAPMIGSWSEYVLAMLLFILTSLGVGFHFSLSAHTDSQAVQYAMTILLASIFFSGFFLALNRLRPAVQIVSWLIPATYGTTMLQSIMLLGQQASLILYIALALASVVLFILAWARLQRLMRSR